MPEEKGLFNQYTQIPVKQREYYYDYKETDSAKKKDFGDMMADLKDMNDKLKKEIGTENRNVKLEIDIGKNDK